MRGEVQLPRRLNQPPTGSHFLRQVSELNMLSQPEQFIGESETALPAPTFI